MTETAAQTDWAVHFKISPGNYSYIASASARDEEEAEELAYASLPESYRGKAFCVGIIPEETEAFRQRHGYSLEEVA